MVIVFVTLMQYVCLRNRQSPARSLDLGFALNSLDYSLDVVVQTPMPQGSIELTKGKTYERAAPAKP